MVKRICCDCEYGMLDSEYKGEEEIVFAVCEYDKSLLDDDEYYTGCENCPLDKS